ncbi:probable ATP-dependent RNA helicase DDX31 [Hypomesus transpacificus]|uniref:probable ATP-dependent RNA helicase DDX31 n=1 Tax=Hypomesus transpacificus TaxID=137520 RepID=UPI001F07D0B2|nr:probable ATP-dependent RNA helicase DDX31 [Hypomesus transpacificus]
MSEDVLTKKSKGAPANVKDFKKKAKKRKFPLGFDHQEQSYKQGKIDQTDNKTHIKTSSLFKNNPEILDVDRPTVTQVKENVFTSDSFSELNLHPHLVVTLNKVLNLTCMTCVQKQTIPVLMCGRDAVVRSQTGSGKTLAYGIPMVQALQSVEPKIKRGDGPLAVIIVPTRELAQQTYQIFLKLLKPFTWIVPGVLMGGEKRKAEKARLRKGINILISTPGRLVDHIKNTLSIAFSATRWLILDEADRTLDLGFEKDLTVILNSLNSTAPSRQNVMLSATLTDGLSRLTGVCMKNPVSIHVSENSKTSSEITYLDVAAQSQTMSFSVPDNLQQYVVVVPSKLRLVCLAAFILARCKFENGHKLIVFVSSCEGVEFLFSLFTSVLCHPTTNQLHPLNFLRLHGNMKQRERTEVFQEFSVCRDGVLLCTDVASRGLDLPKVTWIVQYSPTTAAEYVHRVGRTARIGAQGNSLLFITPAETAYISELANHNISLSEMKLQDILSCLMLDDTYKGRGKYHKSSGALEQEIRERATVLQTEFENVVHANEENVQLAKKALQSFVRAYTAYPSSVKHIFHIRTLHLGHAAKSFGLRDAPQGLTQEGSADHAKGSGKARNQAKRHDKNHGNHKLSAKERMSTLLCSEFSSGI